MSIKNILAKELKGMLEKNINGVEMIDVRTPDEFDVIHIIGAKLIPGEKIEERMKEIDWSKKVVMICRIGIRSKIIAEKLANEQGKQAFNLGDGLRGCFDVMDANQMIIDQDKIHDYLD